MAEGLEVNERIGGKGVHVIAAKYMYPFHWLMTDPNNGGSEGVVHLYPLCAPTLKQHMLSPWRTLSDFQNVECFFSLSFSCARVTLIAVKRYAKGCSKATSRACHPCDNAVDSLRQMIASASL